MKLGKSYEEADSLLMFHVTLSHTILGFLLSFKFKNDSSDMPEHALTFLDLPFEIYLQILTHLHFEDYVALTMVNHQLRSMLDTPMVLAHVYDQFFKPVSTSYGFYPIKISKKVTYSVFRLFSDFTTRNLDLSEESCMNLLKDPDAYSTLAYLLVLNDMHLKYQVNQFDKTRSLDLSGYAFLKKAFQAQNYEIANGFFLWAGNELSEETLYQISRYSSDFFENAHWRGIVHRRINAKLETMNLPPDSLLLTFHDIEEFTGFIKEFCYAVLHQLPRRRIVVERGWSTIAAFYAGLPCGGPNDDLSNTFRLFILKKFLIDRIFRRLNIVIMGESFEINVAVSSKVLFVGPIPLVVSESGRSIATMLVEHLRAFGIYRFLGSPERYLLDYQYVANDIRLKSIDNAVNWIAAVPSTFSFEIVKYISAGEVVNTAKFLKNFRIAPKQTKKELAGFELLFKRGQLVLSKFHGIIGVIISDTPSVSKWIKIAGINSGITDRFKIGDFQKIHPLLIAKNSKELRQFVHWLTRNDHFIYQIGTSFTHLILDEEFCFRLVNREPSRQILTRVDTPGLDRDMVAAFKQRCAMMCRSEIVKPRQTSDDTAPHVT